MPTPTQLRLIHVAARQVGLNDAQYRTLLSNVAGVDSSRDLDQAGFEDVMATLEDMGFTGNSQLETGNFWRNKVEQRGSRAGSRMSFKIMQLAVGLRYPLESLVWRFSDGRTAQVEELTPREAWKLIECLKGIQQRTKNGRTRGKDPAAGTDARSLFDQVAT